MYRSCWRLKSCVHRELIKTCNTQILQVAWNICCHHAIQVMCATSECTMKSYCIHLSICTDGNTLTHCCYFGLWWYIRTYTEGKNVLTWIESLHSESGLWSHHQKSDQSQQLLLYSFCPRINAQNNAFTTDFSHFHDSFSSNTRKEEVSLIHTYLKLLEVKVVLHHVANLSTIIQELK